MEWNDSSLKPRPSHVFQHFSRETLKNMGRPEFKANICIMTIIYVRTLIGLVSTTKIFSYRLQLLINT